MCLDTKLSGEKAVSILRIKLCRVRMHLCLKRLQGRQSHSWRTGRLFPPNTLHGVTTPKTAMLWTIIAVGTSKPVLVIHSMSLRFGALQLSAIIWKQIAVLWDVSLCTDGDCFSFRRSLVSWNASLNENPTRNWWTATCHLSATGHLRSSLFFRMRK